MFPLTYFCFCLLVINHHVMKLISKHAQVFLGVHKPITPRLLDDGRIQTCPRYNPKQSYQRQKKLLIVSTVVFAAVIIIIASVLCFFVISYYLTSKEINQQTQSGAFYECYVFIDNVNRLLIFLIP